MSTSLSETASKLYQCDTEDDTSEGTTDIVVCRPVTNSYTSTPTLIEKQLRIFSCLCLLVRLLTFTNIHTHRHFSDVHPRHLKNIRTPEKPCNRAHITTETSVPVMLIDSLTCYHTFSTDKRLCMSCNASLHKLDAMKNSIRCSMSHVEYLAALT